ncbi:MAG: toll/interleukin-1 receptor domain-containing protein [Opitutales bacterium]
MSVGVQHDPSLPGIFLSYSRKDLKIAEGLRESLLGRGFNIWMDMESIEPTQEWRAVIEKALIEHPVFLFLHTENAGSSEMCRFELGSAVEHQLTIWVIEPEDMPATALSPILSSFAVDRWVLRPDINSLARRISNKLSSEKVFLNELHSIHLSAIRWEEHHQSVDHLYQGEALRGGQRIIEAAERLNQTGFPIARAYLQASEDHEAQQRERQQESRARRRILYVSLFVLTLGLFGLSVYFNNQYDDSLAEADMRKEQAQGLVDYLLIDAFEKLRQTGRVEQLSYSLEPIVQYFENVSIDHFVGDDYLHYARMGHLIADVNLAYGKPEDALGILEKCRLIDDMAIERYPEGDVYQLSLTATLFWVAQAKVHLEGPYAGGGELLEIYEICKKHREISDQWKHTYFNAVYNLLWYYLEDGQRSVAVQYFKELEEYYASLDDPDIDEQSQILFALSIIAKHDILEGDYSVTEERNRPYRFDWNTSDYGFDRMVAILNQRLALSYLGAGRLEEAENLLKRCYQALRELESFDPSTYREATFLGNNLVGQMILASINGRAGALAPMKARIDEIYNEGLYMARSENSIALKYWVAGIILRIANNESPRKEYEKLYQLFQEESKKGSLRFSSKSEYARAKFMVFLYAHRAGDELLREHAAGSLRELVLEDTFHPMLSRPLSAFVRSGEILGRATDLHLEVREFLDTQDCFDPFLSVLESNLFQYE